ncbi:hypothetical protein HMPREF3067_07820 [Corynebacterium sp. HMSC04H06]|nr:hypothetical protein HMPREF3067_07820 [Corynebacterium sp. HMSC04H06]
MPPWLRCTSKHCHELLALRIAEFWCSINDSINKVVKHMWRRHTRSIEIEVEIFLADAVGRTETVNGKSAFFNGLTQ